MSQQRKTGRVRPKVFMRCCTQQAGSMMAERFSIVPGPPIVALARSRHGAARRRPSAKSRAAFTRVLAMLPVHWPAPKRSTNRVAIASGSRCCSPTSNASSSLVAFGFVARAVRRTSSRWQPLHRTCAGSQSWSSGRRRRSSHVWCRQGRCHSPLLNAAPPHRKRMTPVSSTNRGSHLAVAIGDFCNKIGTNRTSRNVPLFDC